MTRVLGGEIGSGNPHPSQTGRMDRKTRKIQRNPEFRSSHVHSRRCKNTAVRGAGQARTTICSILLRLHRTIFGNSPIPLCKTEKPAALAGSPSKLAIKITTKSNTIPEPRPISQPPQGAESVHSLWTPVRVVDNPYSTLSAASASTPCQPVMMLKAGRPGPLQPPVQEPFFR
jgi:hypothetical protein